MNLPLRQYWNLLATYLAPQKKKVAALAVLLLTHIGVQLFNPQIIRFFIDAATGEGAGAQAAASLASAALLFIGGALAGQVLAVAVTYVSTDVAWAATNALRADLALHCLRLDMSFHKQHTPGEMIERIDGDVNALSNFFSQFVIAVLGNALLLLGIVALMWRESAWLGVAMTAFVLITLVVLNRVRHYVTPLLMAARQTSAELFGFIEERLSGAEDIRANGGVGYVLRRLSQYMSRRFHAWRRPMGTLIAATARSLFTLGIGMGFIVSAYLFHAGAITLGAVYVIFYYTDMLRIPMEQLTRQLQDLQRATAGILRLQTLVGTQSKIQDGPGVRRPLDRGASSVEFNDVWFEYEERGTVLHGLSFQLQPGKVLGLLGRTGSGKTTLTRLLYRLYDPASGVIRLDGVDLREPRLAELRRHVGVVTQDVQLFRAAVRDNLTFFDRNISDDEILRVLKEIGLWSWYQALPNGLDAHLAAGSEGLSAGEAQLLAFARVFLKNPGLVILDEASSRLDPATEQRIERAVSRLLAGRTGLIVAHRLGTVQRADEIMILENGRIGEHGPRAQLAADPNSRFYRLLQTGMEEVLA
jgi:ATP-binding cassette subfamily B protein